MDSMLAWKMVLIKLLFCPIGAHFWLLNQVAMWMLTDLGSKHGSIGLMKIVTVDTLQSKDGMEIF